MASLTDSLPPRRAASELWHSYLRASAVAVGLGGAFGAGALLGGGAWSDDAVQADKGSSLALANARSDKLDAVKKQLKLRFHGELVGAPRDAKERPRATKGHAPAQAAAMAAREKALADQASAPEEEQAEESVREEDADEVVESIAAPHEDPPRDPRRIAAALARVLGDDAPAWTREKDPDPAEVSREATPSSGPPNDASAARFFVQVAATPSQEGAEGLVARLAGQGVTAQHTAVDLGARGRVFRVRVGPFADREVAEARAATLSGFVVRE